MITISINQNFITANFIQNRNQEVILAKINQIKIIYSHRCFRTIDCNVDNKFEPLWGGLTYLKIKLNTDGKDEQVPEVGWCICTIKERTRETHNTLKFKIHPPGYHINGGIQIHLYQHVSTH